MAFHWLNCNSLSLPELLPGEEEHFPSLWGGKVVGKVLSTCNGQSVPVESATEDKQ